MLHETPAVNSVNIEGHDLFKGEINVAVCDGFVGNVILKTSESVAHADIGLNRNFAATLCACWHGVAQRLLCATCAPI